jgi:DNA helicase-2/ATP-dependent DNA helicase PcrA
MPPPAPPSDVASTAPLVYPPRERSVDVTPRDFTAELNREQAAAATHASGPLLVIAGAGTGKTRTLVYRVAHLIERGVPPERILLLTFTRRAAHEMLSRAERLVGSASTRVQGGTFHATGHRLLRQFGPEAGLARSFSIPKKETLHYVYSRHINAEVPIETLIEREVPQFVEQMQGMVRVYAEYVSRKSERNLVDYDDLLLFWALMLEQSPALADRIAGLYDHILVDEYQDTNLLQARILRGMCRSHSNITVVGDDAQSIYSFRGASFRNILDFPKQFEGTQVVALEQNYRSTQPILDTTNTLISRALERFTKALWTERIGSEPPWLVTARDEQLQTRFVVDRVLELHEEGMPLREMAVLVRAAYMSADLEIELTNRNIPFEKWGGLKFLEAAHVKDVLAFLRVLDNPRDEVSWYRILMLMPGIGDTTARAIMQTLAERSWDPDAFARFEPPARAHDAHRDLADLLRRLRGAKRGEAGAGEDIDEVRLLYDALLAERYDRSEPRLADLDQLRVIAAGYPSRAAFLAALALEPPQSTQDLGSGSQEEDDALVISTVHSAKGKEWDAVFVIWAVDGWFPSSRSLDDDDQLEEERRLMYVAMTRARNHLAVTYPLNVYATRRGSDYSIDQLSRFIDRGVRDKMRRVVPQNPAAPQSPERQVPADSPPIDLRALLRGRFEPPKGPPEGRAS